MPFCWEWGAGAGRPAPAGMLAVAGGYIAFEVNGN